MRAEYRKEFKKARERLDYKTGLQIAELSLASQSIYNNWCLKITVHLEVSMEKPTYLAWWWDFIQKEEWATVENEINKIKYNETILRR